MCNQEIFTTLDGGGSKKIIKKSQPLVSILLHCLVHSNSVFLDRNLNGSGFCMKSIAFNNDHLQLRNGCYSLPFRSLINHTHQSGLVNFPICHQSWEHIFQSGLISLPLFFHRLTTLSYIFVFYCIPAQYIKNQKTKSTLFFMTGSQSGPSSRADIPQQSMFLSHKSLNPQFEAVNSLSLLLE